MSNRTLPALVAGAFVTALGSLNAVPASADDMAMQKMMKENQAKAMAAMKTGKFDKCYGVALKGQNDCSPEPAPPAPGPARRTMRATRGSWCRRARAKRCRPRAARAASSPRPEPAASRRRAPDLLAPAASHDDLKIEDGSWPPQIFCGRARGSAARRSWPQGPALSDDH